MELSSRWSWDVNESTCRTMRRGHDRPRTEQHRDRCGDKLYVLPHFSSVDDVYSEAGLDFRLKVQAYWPSLLDSAVLRFDWL